MKVILRYLKVLTAFLVLTAFVYGGYYFFRGSTLTVPPLFPSESGERLLISMNGFHFIHSENGAVAWRMNAGSADLYENKEAHLQDIDITFISSTKEKREATLLGENGTLNTENGNGTIRRGAREVRIATSDGYLLTTNSLSWKAGERLIWTSDPFKLLGKELYLEGTGISADVDMRTVLVKNNVKAVLQE
jgi:LPS export ABC transporter protein LptC